MASVYRALAEHAKREAYPEAVEQAHADFDALQTGGAPAQSGRHGAQLVTMIVLTGISCTPTTHTRQRPWGGSPGACVIEKLPLPAGEGEPYWPQQWQIRQASQWWRIHSTERLRPTQGSQDRELMWWRWEVPVHDG
ncbi:hypothetical protein NKH77_56080 [Streptomyces sp. M19]